MNAITPVPSSEYDSGRINSLLHEEIGAFVGHLSENTLSHEQELRGGLISWFCYFLPELIAVENAKLLKDSVQTNRTEHFERWYQLLPLEMALFGLTRDEAWLNNHKRNLAYGGSGLRYYTMESLALAVPELYFDDPQLQSAIRYGLSIPYFGAEFGAAMLAMCKGETATKIALLTEWDGSFRLNRPDILKELSSGNSVENGFFLGPFFQVQSYVVHRLCNRQPQAATGSPATFLFVGSLLDQIKKHPMMHSRLQIPDGVSAVGAT